MLTQTLPPAAEDYAAEQRIEIGAAVAAVRRIWRRMGDDFDAGWLVVGPRLLEVFDMAQETVALQAQEYIPQVLSETGQRARVVQAVNPLSLVGFAGDGRTTEGLVYGAVTRAKTLVGAGAPVEAALQSSSQWLTTSVGTALSDTGRASERLAVQARPAVTGYVRMLTPPSCGRCVILAGKWSPNSTPFLRHPRCDCRNIPASESDGQDMTVNAKEYLSGLSDEELAKALGSQANARAYRDGADMNQLVNAYRRGGDVRPAQVYGRNVKYTTEGTTRRGVAYQRMSQAGYVQRAKDVRDGRYRRTLAPRLMPESIDQVATSAEDRMRLLRLYGWVL